MNYKGRDSIPTGIHTRIDDRARISSAWRMFGNDHFETRAWETLLWVDEKLVEQFDTCRSADTVIDMHNEIMNKYLTEKGPKGIKTTEQPSEAAAETGLGGEQNNE